MEACGGRIHFTEEITFSSTELINRHFNVFEPHIRRHLDSLREDGGLNEMHRAARSRAGLSVVLVGDTIIDEYQYVLPMGKPPKENIIATRYQDREIFAGGVFAAANHVASFCKEVEVITCLGTTDEHEDLVRRSLQPNVKLHAIKRPGMPTTLKRRFVDPSYMRKLFEVYLMDDEPLTIDLQGELDGLIAQHAPGADVVIATDFGHGLLGPSSIEALAKHSRFLAVNTQSNSANLGYNLITKYPKADYVCIDAPEARLCGERPNSPASATSRAGWCDDHIDCPKIIITHGKHGCVSCERDGPAHTHSGRRAQGGRHGRRRRRVPRHHGAARRGRRQPSIASASSVTWSAP